MEALPSRETLADPAANHLGSGRFEASSWLEGEFGYGVTLFGGGYTGTLTLGFGLSEVGTRDWRVAWRLSPSLGDDVGLEVSLDAIRHDPTNDNGLPEHGVTLRADVRW